jgi:hypothetical protein
MQIVFLVSLIITFVLSKDLALETAICQFTDGDVITVDSKQPLSVGLAVRWGETDKS